MKFIKPVLIALTLFSVSHVVVADNYLIDTKGGHAGINFKFKHVGISWLVGEFKTFEGSFVYDPDNVSASSVIVDIDTTSLDSNHAARDEHLSEADYLNSGEFPTAKFVSSSVVDKGEGNMTVNGDLTLRGITKPVVMEVTTVGAGETRWNDYRIGLEGTTTLDVREFGIETFGPEHLVHMTLVVEGIRQD